MKRLAFLFLFAIPFLNIASAQIFHIGFYGGATMTDIPGTDNIDNDADFEHLGFVLAGTVSAQISAKTKLQMEIRYIQRGAQQNPAYDTTYGTNGTINNIGLNDYFTLILDYVDVTVGIKRQIHFNIRNKATDRYGIEAGVSVGALIHSYYSTQSIIQPIDVNTLDISPYIGLYYNITPHFYVEGRYSNSVTTALKADNTNSNSFYNIYYGTWNAGHNIAFSLTLGFNLGKMYDKPANTTPPPSAPSDDNN